MKRMLAILALTFAIVAFSQTNGVNTIDWRNGKPGVQVVTNAPSRAEFLSLSNTVSALSLGTSISNYVKAVAISTNRYELYLVTP